MSKHDVKKGYSVHISQISPTSHEFLWTSTPKPPLFQNIESFINIPIYVHALTLFYVSLNDAEWCDIFTPDLLYFLASFIINYSFMWFQNGSLKISWTFNAAIFMIQLPQTEKSDIQRQFYHLAKTSLTPATIQIMPFYVLAFLLPL